MDPEKIVALANQIAENQQCYPEEKAVAITANHITMFWEPRMIAILRNLQAPLKESLHPYVQKALEQGSF